MGTNPYESPTHCEEPDEPGCFLSPNEFLMAAIESVSLGLAFGPGWLVCDWAFPRSPMIFAVGFILIPLWWAALITTGLLLVGITVIHG